MLRSMCSLLGPRAGGGGEAVGIVVKNFIVPKPRKLRFSRNKLIASGHRNKVNSRQFDLRPEQDSFELSHFK